MTTRRGVCDVRFRTGHTDGTSRAELVRKAVSRLRATAELTRPPSVAIRNVLCAHNLQAAEGIVHWAFGFKLVTLSRHDLESRPEFIREHVADVDRSIAAA